MVLTKFYMMEVIHNGEIFRRDPETKNIPQLEQQKNILFDSTGGNFFIICGGI